MSSRHALQGQLSPSRGVHGKPGRGARVSNRLPEPCGTLSAAVARSLTTEGGSRPAPRPSDVRTVDDPLADRDFQLALWMLYELHYRGFEEVPDVLEWDPLLLAARAALEHRFEEAVRALAEPGADPGVLAELTRGAASEPPADVADEVVRRLVDMTRGGAEGGAAAYLAEHATAEQFVSYLRQRAVYHLRESDPQSFVLPRIGGPAKVALAELQYDEYGAGRPDRLHQQIFARGLEALGLTTDLTTYVDEAEAETLASVNTMSLFALNRRLRGAALGHLAAFEATSSLPCAKVADGARRLGLPEEVVDYYEEHVEADAVHEQLAIRSICGALVAEDPRLAPDVVMGAAACLAVDGLAADVLVARWRDEPIDAGVAS